MTNAFLFITKGHGIQLVSDTDGRWLSLGAGDQLGLHWGDIETAQNKRNAYSLIHTKQRFICLFVLSSGGLGDSSAGKRGPVQA